MKQITTRGLASLIKQAKDQGKAVTLSQGVRHGSGGLRVRATPYGTASFFFRYYTSEGKRDDLPIGKYDVDGTSGLSLAEAQDKAGELAKLYQSGVKDIREHLKREQRTHEAELRREKEEQEHQQADTLGALLQAYLDYLKAKGSPSAYDVGKIIELHIVKPFPELAGRRANDITADDMVIVFDRMHKVGIRRGMAKARSLLHAAFNLALKAKFSSTIPAEFRRFRLSGGNPIAALPTYSELSKPGERTLTTAELRHLLDVLHTSDSTAAKAVLMGLYLGGQRPTQLLRATAQDVDFENSTITLRDGKGRRQHPRLHVLPIMEPVTGILRSLVEINAEAPSLFSFDGKTSPWPNTLSGIVRDACNAAYRLGDVRRTCETELARLGVEKHIRAQILSHELSGVQTKHYDKYSYLDEKRNALAQWAAYLDGLLAGNVVPMRKGGKA